MCPELKTLERELINSEITSLNSCGEQAIFKLDIKLKAENLRMVDIEINA